MTVSLMKMIGMMKAMEGLSLPIDVKVPLGSSRGLMILAEGIQTSTTYVGIGDGDCEGMPYFEYLGDMNEDASVASTTVVLL